jgi:hypothetical protein
MSWEDYVGDLGGGDVAELKQIMGSPHSRRRLFALNTKV